jgi:uncharacterized repeat protein (TIGR03803 family)
MIRKTVLALLPTLLTWATFAADGLTTLVSFGGTNGASPMAGVILAADGNFYGTTRIGGTHNLGTIFRLTPAGALSSLASFDGTNGAYPRGALAQTGDGNPLLFGTTSSGGTSNLGTAFQCSLSGLITPLVSFTGLDGANPQSGLTRTSDGHFRGTTYYGGTNDWPLGYGTAFHLTTNGQLTTEFSFANDNGAGPYAGLIQGNDDQYYGTTQVGGANGFGTVFKLTTSGSLTTLVSFNSTNGAFPFARLAWVAPDSLYGTTYSGGLSNFGTVFRVTTHGVLTSLESFTGSNGARPYGGLVRAADGNLYGTTAEGGTHGLGTLYRLTTNGTLTTLVSFAGPNGNFPQGDLVVDSSGNLFGTTTSGGETGNGTVFRFNLAPPAAPAFESIIPSGNTLTLSWYATVGKSYQLQFKTNLNQASWQNLGAVTIATNALMTTLDSSATNPHRFYRLELLP